MRERLGVAGLLSRTELQEGPRLDGEEGQRDHLGRGEERAQRHVLHRGSGEVQVVHRADHPARRVQDDVEEDDAQRDPLPHHAEQHEDVGDHHRGEQLEEVLDPQVHHPEPPEVGDGEVGVAAGQQPDGVERRDRQTGEEEHPRHAGLRCGLQACAQAAEDDRDPHEQPDDQQDLPDPGEVQVLPLLGEQGALGDDPEDRQCLADQRPHHHDGDRTEQAVGQPVLPLRFAPGDERRQEDPRGQERRRRPQQRQLHMPGPGQVVGQQAGQIQAEERAQVGAVVLGQRAEQGLHQEQQGDDREEPHRGALRGGQPHLAGLLVGDGGRVGGVPADLLAPAPVDGEQDPGAAQQRDQRQRRPDNEIGGGPVVHPRFGRPVVGVGVVESRPFGGRRPRTPGEERRQVVDVGGLGDQIGGQPDAAGVRAEMRRVVLAQAMEGGGLRLGEHQGVGGLVEAVGPELADHPVVHLRDAGLLELRGDVLGGPPQVVGGVVGSEVGAVAVHRSVLHQPAGLEQFLAAGDVLAGEQHRAGLVDHLLGHRHRGRVGAVGQDPHDEEPEDHHQGHTLHPGLADR